MRSRTPGPPRMAGWLLRRLSRSEDRLPLEGDFGEEFEWRLQNQGAAKARLWFWRHLLKSAPAFIRQAVYWRTTMFKNYWTIAWRNLAKHKGHSFIKIAGLALGLACCLLAYLHIRTELSYDDFHQNGPSIFRVIRTGFTQEDYKVKFRDPSLSPQMGSLLPPNFPEIQAQTRYAEFLSGIVTIEDRLFQETLSMADASFFRMFSFPLRVGDPEAVLATENDIVLTESCARRYFGSERAVGRRLAITYGDMRKDFIVSGIAADPPVNSIFQFACILPIDTLPAFLNAPGFLTEWSEGVWPLPVYVQLKPGFGKADMEKRFPAFTAQFFDRDIVRARANGWSRPEVPYSFALQNIRDVYLDSSVYLGKGLSESMVLSGIVLMILLMAGVNFTSLSLGTAAFRAKEIGIRKVIGAERRHLIHQFWGETMLTVGGAAAAGAGLAIFALPAFNRLIGQTYRRADLLSLSNILAIIALVLFTGALTAAYPSLVMASFRPVEIIRGKFRFGRKKGLAKALVVFQFGLSALLIISSLVFQKQMRALNEKDLGYKREGLLAVRTQENRAESSRQLVALFRERVLRSPHVLGVSASSAAFGLSPTPRQDTDRIDLHWNGVDAAFLRTIGAKVVLGEDFRPDQAADSNTALVNASFVRAFGVDSPIGLTIGEAVALHEPGYDIPDSLKPLRIRGVTEDFQFAPLSYGIFPAIFHSQPAGVFSRILVRVSAGSLPETMKFLEQQWRDIRPDKPFLFYFQDQALHQLLNAERRWTRIVGFCSLAAILLACMGVFGLTSISLNARVKEIGIRKTFGAPTLSIIGDVYRDLLGQLGAALVLAWPAAFFLLQKALRKFPYRIKIPAGDFLLGGLLIAAVTVSITLVLVLKAASASPVDSLHRE